MYYPQVEQQYNRVRSDSSVFRKGFTFVCSLLKKNPRLTMKENSSGLTRLFRAQRYQSQTPQRRKRAHGCSCNRPIWVMLTPTFTPISLRLWGQMLWAQNSGGDSLREFYVILLAQADARILLRLSVQTICHKPQSLIIKRGSHTKYRQTSPWIEMTTLMISQRLKVNPVFSQSSRSQLLSTCYIHACTQSQYLGELLWFWKPFQTAYSHCPLLRTLGALSRVPDVDQMEMLMLLTLSTAWS